MGAILIPITFSSNEDLGQSVYMHIMFIGCFSVIFFDKYKNRTYWSSFFFVEINELFSVALFKVYY